MKPAGGLSFLDPSRRASDLTTYFEKLWHDLEERADASTGHGDSSKVWLRCTGELSHIGSIAMVAVRAYRRGGESIEFICPRCDQRHESRLLR